MPSLDAAHYLRDMSDEEFWAYARERANAGSCSPEVANSAAEQFLECILGRETCLLPLAVIEEVIPSPARYTLLPSSPGWMAGLAAWRGEVMAVVDLESYLTGIDSDASQATRATARVAPTLHETDADQSVAQGRGDPRGRPGTSALHLTPMTGASALTLTPMTGTSALQLTPTKCPPGGLLLCTHYRELALGLYVAAIGQRVMPGAPGTTEGASPGQAALDGEILLAGIAHQIGMAAQDV